MSKCKACDEGQALLFDDFGKRFHYDVTNDRKFPCQETGPVAEGLTIMPELPKSNNKPYPELESMSDVATQQKAEPYPPLPPSFQRYDEILDATFAKVKELSKVKGGEYAGDFDRLANFRRQARDAELPMETIWRVYSQKHWDAIMQYEKDLRLGKDRPRSEPILGRIDDLITYCILFKLMYEERHNGPSNS